MLRARQELMPVKDADPDDEITVMVMDTGDIHEAMDLQCVEGVVRRRDLARSDDAETEAGAFSQRRRCARRAPLRSVAAAEPGERNQRARVSEDGRS